MNFFDSFLIEFLEAAFEENKRVGNLVQVDEVIILEESTIKLVDEIVEANRLRMIDHALDTRNEELFMQLTNWKGENLCH